MSEKETIFSSKIKYDGVFLLKNFYKFCHEWLTEETGLNVSEGKYAEKIAGDTKEVEIEWAGSKKITDYFKYEVKVKFVIRQLKNIEIIQEGVKIKTNQGSVEVGVKADLVRDYEGKFERSAFKKFMRSIYEKYIIPARIEEYEDKLISKCDGFLEQAKAYLDLEGRK